MDNIPSPFPALHKQGIVVHICNARTWEVEAGGLEVQDHSQVYSEFVASLYNIHVSYFCSVSTFDSMNSPFWRLALYYMIVCKHGVQFAPASTLVSNTATRKEDDGRDRHTAWVSLQEPAIFVYTQLTNTSTDSET